METLIKKIQDGIENKKFCIVFQGDVEKIVNDRIGIDPKIKKSVEAFAKKHGWKPTITDAGLRVTFRKLS